jgi:Sec-independent protein translocase protein TatA
MGLSINSYGHKEAIMAQKGGTLKRVFITLIFLVLLVIVFVLMGGGNLLKKTGSWIGGVGKQAEDVKQTIEKKATTIEKTVEKLKDSDKPGEKK